MKIHPAPRRILLIRRDNIGDMVLTTPFIHALRTRFSEAWIGVLGNSYNTPVLAGHPDIDEVFAYDKAKHRGDRGRLAVFADTARLLLRLRARQLDLVILAGPGAQRQAARLARWIRPRATLGFVEADVPAGLSHPLPYGGGAALHEAQDVFRLGAALGIGGEAGPCVLSHDAAQGDKVRAALRAAGAGRRKVVAVHVSVRRVRQRWPAARFAALINRLAARGDVQCLLLWSPGPDDDPRHPGDDAKAQDIRELLPAGVACLPWPTPDLAALAGALAGADLMVCADGGAMHVAAGLGVPVVALFGDSPVDRWRPWGVRHQVIRAPGGDVGEIDEGAVYDGCARLLHAPDDAI